MHILNPDKWIPLRYSHGKVTPYRVAQNHGKQVLRMSNTKFPLPIIQFVVIEQHTLIKWGSYADLLKMEAISMLI